MQPLQNKEQSSAAAVLFGKTRQAVLGLLYEQPDQGRYLRELARLTGISSGALQHELTRLLAADLVTREADGNRVSYKANTAHPIFAELQSIIRKTCGLPSQLKTALAPLAERISFATLYGSVAKGTEHAHSDADLLLVGNVGLADALRELAPLESKIGREISVRVYDRDDFRRRRQQGEAFLTRVLTGPMTVLLGSPDGA